MELLDQLRLTVPKEIRAAEEVLAQRDHILNLAQTDARRTKSQAEDDYRERVDKHDILMQAEQRAATLLRDAEDRSRRMIEQAEQQSEANRSDADAYALRSLRTLEQELNTITSAVRRGIDVLSGPATATLTTQYFGDPEPVR
jgi:vacuolar-type H+-ATPase subunit H